MLNIQKVALAVALIAAPGLAHAGTSTATGSANFNVINQCSITGATVNLGTYTSSNTVGDVAADLGGVDLNFDYIAGNRGVEYANWGTVTCDIGTPYTVEITGTNSNPEDYATGAIQFNWVDASSQQKSMKFQAVVKKIGDDIVPDNFEWWPGAGAIVSIYFRSKAAGVGTGLPQEIRGSAVYDQDASQGIRTDLLKPGTYTDTLTYTLNF